jgi:hypothetical protein
MLLRFLGHDLPYRTRMDLAQGIEAFARARRETVREWSFERSTLSVDLFQGHALLTDSHLLGPEGKAVVDPETFLRTLIGHGTDQDPDLAVAFPFTMATLHENAKARAAYRPAIDVQDLMFGAVSELKGGPSHRGCSCLRSLLSCV